jgi:serine/threonine protein kinase
MAGYRLLGALGAGGMGRVFLALSPGHRLVALKVVHQGLLREPEFRARFRREIQAARQVSGAFTASIVDADAEAAVPWLATLYLPCLSLREYVRLYGPLPAGRVLALGAGLAEALRSIHAAGIIHRDLTPDNVLLTHDSMYVVDFGISQALEGTRMTLTGQLLGTVGFTAPERLTSAERAGPPGDVFCLAAVLVFAALGHGPFDGGRPDEVAFRTVHGQPRLHALPEELRLPVAAGLNKDPDLRVTLEALLEAFTPLPPLPPPPVTFLAELARRWHCAIALAAAPPARRPSSAYRLPTLSSGAPQDPAGGWRRGVSRRSVLAGAGALAVAGAAGALIAVRAGRRSGADPARSPAEPTPTAEPLWSAALPQEAIDSELVLLGDTLVCVGQDEGEARGFSCSSGEQLWTLQKSGGSANESDGNAIIAFGGASGSAIYGWAFDTLQSVDAGGRARTVQGYADDSPLLYSDILAASGNILICAVVMVGSSDNEIIAYDLSTGQELWTRALQVRPVATSLAGVCAVTDARLCYLQDGTTTYALNLAGGAEVWQAQDTVPLGCPSTLALASGTLLVAGTRLLALDAATGHQRWTAADRWTPTSFYSGTPNNAQAFQYIEGRFTSLLDVQGKTAYFVNGSNTVFAVETSTGKTVWTYTSDALSGNGGFSSFPAQTGFATGSFVAVPCQTQLSNQAIMVRSILVLDGATGTPLRNCRLPASVENWAPQVLASGSRIYTLLGLTIYAFEGES